MEMAMSSDNEIGNEGVEDTNGGRSDRSGSTDIHTNNNNTAGGDAGPYGKDAAEELSQSLAEDDSVAQSTKSSSMFISSSESAFGSTSTAVTAERKEVLLAQARADRLDWIRRVPLPYRAEGKKARDCTAAASSSSSAAAAAALDSDAWDRDPRLSELKNTFALQKSQSALEVLSHLYGIGHTLELPENSFDSVKQVSKRVGAIMDQVISESGGNDGEDRTLAVPTAEQIRSSALAEEEGDAVLRAYHSWVSKLADPAAAVLVQGMRNFCRKICKDDPGSGAAAAAATDNELPNKLLGYLRMTSTSLHDYIPWKDDDKSDETRRSLESFVYGQVEQHLEQLYWTEERKEEEKQWQNRLDALQFVGPNHLEISCLEKDDKGYKEIFEKSVEALVSVEKYFSPFEKLQRILAVYHNVNAALTGALNRTNDSGSKKLPSADDILPSIILTVLLAKPNRLLFNLHFIEDFSPPEYLRGEAGYAYTNLYGAVQFLKDIDLDAENPASLHIEPEEFQNGLKACREAAEAKHALRKVSVVTPLDSDESTKAPLPLSDSFVAVSQIRDARMRGEVIDLEWAKNRLPKLSEAELSTEAGRDTDNDETDGLPKGFTRSYTFLSSRPEDIKLSDLPNLLAEYRMLVHTTEALIGEKFSKANAEKKAKLAAKQKEIYETARQVYTLKDCIAATSIAAREATVEHNFGMFSVPTTSDEVMNSMAVAETN